MIEYRDGNLLEADVEALVNTVNTVGVMGKGIALLFREAFLENYRLYREACLRGEIKIGKMFVVQTGQFLPRFIINFPTKQHWKMRSRLKYIEDGLRDLIGVVKENQIKSIAIPALGCNNGGLNWDDVRPLIEAAFTELPEVRVLVYLPQEKRYFWKNPGI
jgi:O-acetyl-ADP-ribose deacetylase (regulator of RNase III)